MITLVHTRIANLVRPDVHPEADAVKRTPLTIDLSNHLTLAEARVRSLEAASSAMAPPYTNIISL